MAGCQQPTMLNSPAPPLLTAFTACCSRSRCHCLQEHDVLVRHGVQVRVIGDLSLAPPGVQAAAAAIMAATWHHDRAVLNLCFSYT